MIQKGFEDLLAVLPEDKYPKTRGHVSNFLVAGLTAFEYWLKHHHWLTLTLRKIFEPESWERMWRQYFQLHRGLRLQTLHVDYRWILCIT